MSKKARVGLNLCTHCLCNDGLLVGVDRFSIVTIVTQAITPLSLPRIIACTAYLLSQPSEETW
jgi:hypothetical protein